ncbi:MAG: Tad domain-containing protein [Rhizobiales bacterium]|nr:Tad domain-containing protein [Hyphomicrobiales bacterium]
MPSFQHLRLSLGQFRRRTEGNISIVTALAILPLMMAAGAALDYSQALAARTSLQAVLDSAVLAGALASDDKTRDTQAGTYLKHGTASENIKLASSSFKAYDDGSYEGEATAKVDTSFLRIVGVDQQTISAKTVVAVPKVSKKVCILVLDPSANQSLLVNSGANIKGPDCEIHVASTASPAMIMNSGSTLDVARVCVKGSKIIQNGGTISKLELNCATSANPFAGTLPKPSTSTCTVSNVNYSGTNTLSPGVYCGNFNFNGSGTLNLKPGTYVFKNTKWNLNSGWKVNGTGVTFYFADANSYIQVNSGVEINVTAPTSGDYADILFFEPDGLSKSQFSINGSAGHTFEGLIYLPSRNVTFNSMSSVASEAITIVVNQMILNSANWNIAPGKKSINAGGGSNGLVYIKQ